MKPYVYLFFLFMLFSWFVLSLWDVLWLGKCFSVYVDCWACLCWCVCVYSLSVFWV